LTKPDGAESKSSLKQAALWLVAISVVLTTFSMSTTAVTLTENDIANYAAEINSKGKGTDIGGGTVIRHVFSKGRTIIFRYDVPADWQPYSKGREDIIIQAKSRGSAKFFFEENINTNYQYFKSNLQIYSINIYSSQYSNINLELDHTYVNINGHAKSKGVNMRLRPPKGWDIGEANGPNIVKAFNGEPGQYYMIITKDMPSFSTRLQIKEIYSNSKAVKEHAESSMPDYDCTLNEYDFFILNTYPTVTSEYMCDIEQSDALIKLATKVWFIFYEDKLIMLQGTCTNSRAECEQLNKLFNMVSASVYFPEQFN